MKVACGTGVGLILGWFFFISSSFAQSISIDADRGRLLFIGPDFESARSELVLVTTMATWCVACRDELPQFSYLRSAFNTSELQIYGLPYDENESPAQIKNWIEYNRPPYRLIADLSRDEIQSAKALVSARLKINAVPVSILTDSSGRILKVKWGPPSISDVRELLRLHKAHDLREKN